MSTKDVIGQEILCYVFVGRISKLLDQFSSRLCATGLLEVMKTFPEFFVHLFTYTASVSASSVLQSIYVDEGTNEDDVIVVMAHLKKFIADATEEGMFTLLIGHSILYCAALFQYWKNFFSTLLAHSTLIQRVSKLNLVKIYHMVQL